ncbi:hypothetical protein [Maribacter sp. ACAM166]|uniref:hypothetical protein n=1 Tax=Maribacter sp. ACAM166 TaxID=2508996 RepID=UPI0010FE02AF|nr:hypothetical protein [Maribacter sp. ACAM166]TLP81380.1 hypothetical protein ES765_05065 [Maribacter sp. ACAM166]
MKFKSKLKEYYDLIERLIAFLDDPGPGGLTRPQKIKIYKEIVRLDFNIDLIEKMPLEDAQLECQDTFFTFTSIALNRPYYFQPKKITSTRWRNQLKCS